MRLSGFISRSPNDHPESTLKRTLHTQCVFSHFSQKFGNCCFLSAHAIIAAPHFLQRHWGCTRHLLCPLSSKTDTHPKGGFERSAGACYFSQTPSGVEKWHVAAVGQVFIPNFSIESCLISEAVQTTIQVFTREDSSQHHLMSFLWSPDLQIFNKRSKITSQTSPDQFQVFCKLWAQYIHTFSTVFPVGMSSLNQKDSEEIGKLRCSFWQIPGDVSKLETHTESFRESVDFMADPEQAKMVFFIVFRRVGGHHLKDIAVNPGKVVLVLGGLLPFIRFVLSSGYGRVHFCNPN